MGAPTMQDRVHAARQDDVRFYKRGGSGIWWVDFRHAGKRARKSTGTEDRQAAQEWAERLKADLWREHRLGERPAIRWDEAALDWLKAKAGKKSIETDKARLRWLTEKLTGKTLQSIDGAALTALARLKAKEDVSDATVNRVMAAASAVLHYAHSQGRIDRVPKIPYAPEPKQRIRWITPAQAKKLLKALPEHLGDMAAFALATGLRRANVTHLEWPHVDLARRIAWVHADQAKGGKPIGVPLNNDALAVLRRRRGKHARWVFDWRGEPVLHTTTKAWYSSCETAGITDFTFHDLRHTWASWHVQNGTPLPAPRF